MSRAVAINLTEPKIAYYVLPEVVREEMCAGYDWREAARALVAVGALKRGETSRKYTRRQGANP